MTYGPVESGVPPEVIHLTMHANTCMEHGIKSKLSGGLGSGYVGKRGGSLLIVGSVMGWNLIMIMKARSIQVVWSALLAQEGGSRLMMESNEEKGALLRMAV